MMGALGGIKAVGTLNILLFPHCPLLAHSFLNDSGKPQGLERVSCSPEPSLGPHTQ